MNFALLHIQVVICTLGEGEPGGGWGERQKKTRLNHAPFRLNTLFVLTTWTVLKVSVSCSLELLTEHRIFYSTSRLKTIIIAVHYYIYTAQSINVGIDHLFLKSSDELIKLLVMSSSDVLTTVLVELPNKGHIGYNCFCPL